MSDPFGIHDAAAALGRERAERLEALCEEAIQGGEHGVLWDATHGVGRVDACVPYGQIIYVHNVPSFDLRETNRWRSRGRDDPESP